MHASKESVPNSRLGTKYFEISNLVTCGQYSVFMHFLHWPLWKFTSSLKHWRWLLLKNKPLCLLLRYTLKSTRDGTKFYIPLKVGLFALGRLHKLSNFSCLWDWISVRIQLNSNYALWDHEQGSWHFNARIFQMISALDEYLMPILFKENFLLDWKAEYHLGSQCPRHKGCLTINIK